MKPSAFYNYCTEAECNSCDNMREITADVMMSSQWTATKAKHIDCSTLVLSNQSKISSYYAYHSVRRSQADHFKE